MRGRLRRLVPAHVHAPAHRLHHQRLASGLRQFPLLRFSCLTHRVSLPQPPNSASHRGTMSFSAFGEVQLPDLGSSMPALATPCTAPAAKACTSSSRARRPRSGSTTFQPAARLPERPASLGWRAAPGALDARVPGGRGQHVHPPGGHLVPDGHGDARAAAGLPDGLACASPSPAALWTARAAACSVAPPTSSTNTSRTPPAPGASGRWPAMARSTWTSSPSGATSSTPKPAPGCRATTSTPGATTPPSRKPRTT